MKRRIAQTFCVIAISIFIPIISTYLSYYNLAEADFLSQDISYENPDQENLSIDQQGESKLLISSTVPIIFPPATDLLEQLLYFPSATCCLNQKTAVLRC